MAGKALLFQLSAHVKVRILDTSKFDSLKHDGLNCPWPFLFGDFCFQPKAFRLSQELLQNSQEVIEISQEL